MIGVRTLACGSVCGAALLLGACAGASTDPRTGGLAGGITGITTGAYDQRIDDRRRTLHRLDSAEAALSRRLADNHGQLAALDRHIGAQRIALSKLRQDVSGMETRISMVRASITIENRRQFETLGQIDAARIELEHLKVAAAEQEKRNAALLALRQQYETEARLREEERKAIPADRRATIEEIERRAIEADKAQRGLEERRQQIERKIARLSV